MTASREIESCNWAKPSIIADRPVEQKRRSAGNRSKQTGLNLQRLRFQDFDGRFLPGMNGHDRTQRTLKGTRIVTCSKVGTGTVNDKRSAIKDLKRIRCVEITLLIGMLT